MGQQWQELIVKKAWKTRKEGEGQVSYQKGVFQQWKCLKGVVLWQRGKGRQHGICFVLCYKKTWKYNIQVREALRFRPKRAAGSPDLQGCLSAGFAFEFFKPHLREVRWNNLLRETPELLMGFRIVLIACYQNIPTVWLLPGIFWVKEFQWKEHRIWSPGIPGVKPNSSNCLPSFNLNFLRDKMG